MLTALVDFGGGTQDRAQTPADAALASLDGGAAAAHNFAARHEATVVSGPGNDEVTVRVRLGEGTATGRASDAP
mgnify:CR=1